MHTPPRPHRIPAPSERKNRPRVMTYFRVPRQKPAQHQKKRLHRRERKPRPLHSHHSHHHQHHHQHHDSHSPGLTSPVLLTQPRHRPAGRNAAAAPAPAHAPRVGHHHLPVSHLPAALGGEHHHLGRRRRQGWRRDRLPEGRALLVPGDLDRGVVLGEALAVEPELKVQVGGPDEGPDLVRAVQPLLAPGEEAPPGALLELELAVLDAREVGPDGAELLCAGCCFFRCAVVSRRSSPLWQVDGVGCWEGMAYSLSC